MRSCNNYTIMRLAAAWLAMLGCQRADTGLQYLQIGLAEQEPPPILALDPAGVAEKLDSFQGKKSAGVQQVIDLLRESTE